MSPIKAGFFGALLAGLGTLAGSASALEWVGVGWPEIPVRAYASAAAPVVDTVRGGSYLNLTGKCTRDLDLALVAYMHPLKQRALVNTRWCELAGPVHGWIYGGFMKPF